MSKKLGRPRTNLTVVCEKCGKEFQKRKSAVLRTKNNFCSYDCFKSYRRTNNILCFNDHAEIVTQSIKFGENKIIIDLEDVDLVKEYNWAIRLDRKIKNKYAIAHGKKEKTILLHRLITKAKDGLVVDHIDHDGLNNRKSNLRVCTNAENLQNIKRQTGICKVKYGWIAYITLNYKRTNLGTYKTKEKAIEARKNAELEIYKHKKDILCN